MTYLSLSNDRPRSETSAGSHATRRYQAKLSAFLIELQPLAIGLLVCAAAFVAKEIYDWLNFSSAEVSGSTTGVAVVVGLSTFALTFKNSIQSHADRPLGIVLTEYGLKLSAVFVGAIALIGLLAIHDRYPLAFICTWYAVSLGLVGIGLCFLAHWERRIAAAGLLVEKVAIYGSKPQADNIARLLATKSPRTALAGFFANDPALSVGGGLPNSGGLSELLELARSNECDRIIIALPVSDSEQIQKVVTALEAVPTPIQFCLSTSPLPFEACGSEMLGPGLLMNVQQHPLGMKGEIFKSVLDFGLAAVALILSAPLLALIAIAIKYDSPGPVFFVQRRGGYCGRCVKVVKFRTMKVLEDGPVVPQAQRNDDRITKIGAFLRRTSLDELPQLLNVLRGELSLVGPRPHALAHDEYYGKLVERYAARHRMKPGITGWAQVNGCRSETRDPELMRERVKYDLYYISHWSPWLDIIILFRTLKVMFFDSKAY